jgi:hypothetical protein
MKKIQSIVGIVLFCAAFSVNATAQTSTNEVATLSGPRFGSTFVGDGSTSQFLNRVHEMDSLKTLNLEVYHLRGLPSTAGNSKRALPIREVLLSGSSSGWCWSLVWKKDWFCLHCPV